MRYSLFSVQDHYPDRPRTVPRLYDEVIELAERADRLGFDSFLVAEHHFHEYGAAPDPVPLLAAIAQRTGRIRLGPAISVLTFRDPRTVAESYAMLDVLSGGRLLLGVGSGYLKHEFTGFGIDPAENRERFDEALSIVRRLLAGERVTHAGRFHRLDEVAINVRPLQAEPPFYVGILAKEAAFHIGRQGSRMLSVPYASVERFEDTATLLREFRRGQSEAGIGGSDDDAIFTFHCHVAETDEAARRTAADAFDLYVATRLYARRVTYDDVLRSGLAFFGSVDAVAEKLRALESWGIGHVALLMNFGALPQADVLHSVELFASDVIPRVRSG